MSRLDDALREALRREEPPEGFAGRVMARIEARKERGGAWGGLMAAFRGPRLRWAGAFAAAALAIGTTAYQERQRAEGERAKTQVMLALRITGAKLEYARARVQRVK
jgi:hypothetical protein